MLSHAGDDMGLGKTLQCSAFLAGALASPFRGHMTGSQRLVSRPATSRHVFVLRHARRQAHPPGHGRRPKDVARTVGEGADCVRSWPFHLRVLRHLSSRTVRQEVAAELSTSAMPPVAGCTPGMEAARWCGCVQPVLWDTAGTDCDGNMLTLSRSSYGHVSRSTTV